ncbi:AAA family ATPase [Streptomyces sp. SA15]|uniref:AAA family ATPase n=1 Tax=Streptomyces sp. SA15 TaxID=934019 RepID=UPI00359C831F
MTGTGGAVVRTGFVDRVEHMDELRSLMADVTEGRGGRAIVVDGVSGMGKSALLRAFEAEVAATLSYWSCPPAVRTSPRRGSSATTASSTTSRNGWTTPSTTVT